LLFRRRTPRAAEFFVDPLRPVLEEERADVAGLGIPKALSKEVDLRLKNRGSSMASTDGWALDDNTR
jgi:hypothetical protein